MIEEKQVGKHTPGPWVVNGCRVECESGAIVAGVFDGQLNSSDHSKVVERANAALISAAPELLEALELASAALWEDTREVRFDDTVMFGHGYDWDGWESLRDEMHTRAAGSFAIWPEGGQWHAYGTDQGRYWGGCGKSCDSARKVILRHLCKVEPDHPAAKAYLAIAKAKGVEA